MIACYQQGYEQILWIKGLNMKYGYQTYNAIKMLLLKYNIEFKTHGEYEKYIKDLALILNV